MRITVSKDSVVGAIIVPAGDYLVSLKADTQQIRLTGKGLDLLIPAIKRRNQCRGKIETATFFSGGAGQWSLVINSPKLGEWVALMEINRDLPDRKD
ncbi:MAG: hypothetical protein KGQ59_05440 [Bdellovibrionales bacterium]|nr:hypothetical protein [Bdellovibrionales bacterium]